MDDAIDYESWMQRVEKCLQAAPLATHVHYRPFRMRAQHIRRVWMWTRRLLAYYPQADAHVVQLAAIFHDVGYATDMDDHATAGAGICRQMLTGHEPDENIERIADMVKEHAKKDRTDMTLEEMLLCDADLLDEIGALNIIWDSMAEGAEQEQRYEKTLSRLQAILPKVTAQSGKLRTEAGRNLHRQRSEFQTLFCKELAFELGLTTDNPLDR